MTFTFATGRYERCSELVGGSMLACTTLTTPWKSRFHERSQDG